MAKRIPATRISKKKTAEVDEDQAVENMVASLHKDLLREFREECPQLFERLKELGVEVY